jgi:2-dehydro-3-deoxyphosphogluconate aldolase/(4S)-4-hydroxy-2-oxoglutarate aldolase
MEFEKIVAIFRGLDKTEYISTAEALYNGGIKMMEVTFDQRKQESWIETAWAIHTLKESFGEKIIVGAGTVLSERQVELAEEAGASYIVTPTVKKRVILRARELGMGCMAGAMTPTEIVKAYEEGADIVKIFPANVVGVDFFKALRGPLGHIPVAAVGGVNLNNIQAYIGAGAACVGIGGQLVDKELISNKEWEKLEKLAKAYRMRAEK